MNGGLFITLYDKKTLALYLNHGIYGFLMKPVFTDMPSSRSMHYAALADYACSREGTHVFFFIKREIYYGGIIKGNKDIASFYLNGDTSPLGRKSSAPLFWDESNRYTPTNKDGVFKRDGIEKAQPFILQFIKDDEHSGKLISSDDLYFELGHYPYPLPSNTIQGMSFCTLTPGETEIALSLIKKSNKNFKDVWNENITINEKQTLFYTELLENSTYQNEAHLEFSLLANLPAISHLFKNGEYILCRQVPVSPFKPYNMDRADICLYNIENPLKNGTIPNVIIELKKDPANFHAYNQMARYLDWLKQIVDEIEFDQIEPIIIAPSFKIKKTKINLQHEDKIKMYSLNDKQYYLLD
jgi:hypothetical protein